jgi:hypothetical protein
LFAEPVGGSEAPGVFGDDFPGEAAVDANEDVQSGFEAGAEVAGGEAVECGGDADDVHGDLQDGLGDGDDS